MNLPAVILFICFSVAYGGKLQCKVGSENKNELKECEGYCGREEVTYNVSKPSSMSYFCKTEENKEARCENVGCYEKSEIDPEVGDYDLTNTIRICCATEPEFKDYPPLSKKKTSLKCKDGEQVMYKNGEKVEKKEEIPIKDCGTRCVRSERITTGPDCSPSCKSVSYSCDSEEKSSCEKEGECSDHTQSERSTTKTKTCCSTDPDFKDFPSMLSEGDNSSPASSPPDSTTSSAVSTPALLATGIALLGLTF